MTLTEYLVAAIFTGWLVATVLVQLEGHVKTLPLKLKRIDVFGLLPSWTFFAPKPCVSDFHLIFRDRTEDGSTTDWRSTELTATRTTVSVFWNPRKRITKCLLDISKLLAALHDVQPAPVLSFPYLWALHICMKWPRSEFGLFRQFAIASIRPNEPADDVSVVFLSDEHPF